MPAAKDKRSRNKLLKIEVGSGSESDESEHELSYYAKDKVKLMKEVLKLIKPKKIKSMAPDCIKNLDIVEINSMLLEELLGISNKRLQYIFNGENVDRETSSSESEEEKQPIDVISLDDISDDDDIELCISESEKNSLESAKKNKKDESLKIKTEVGETSIKLEKSKKDKKKSKKSTASEKPGPLKENDKDKLMSVLELLELQARARAIRSQLAIENEKKKTSEYEQTTAIKVEEGSDSDAVIIESPEHKEIVITSDSEEDHGSTSQTESRFQANIVQNDVNERPPKKKKKSNSKHDGASTHTSETATVGCTYLVGGTENAGISNQENDDLDNIKKKQILMAKIQKVRLIRNRSKNADGRSISDTSNKDINNTAVDNIVATTSRTSTEINENQLVTRDNININEKQSEDEQSLEEEKQSEDTKVSEDQKQFKDEKQSEKNVDSYKMKSESNNDLTESDKNSEVPNDKVVANSQTTSTKQQTDSYCDNDEIVVINLDDDEMEGIEND